MKWSSVSLLAGLLSFLICIPVAAEMSAADIERTVRKANVLKPNIRVSGLNRGPEVILSVYVAATVPETDLKIDSVMLAKEFFSVDSSLTRTTVNFYDPLKPESYRSVSVRSTDVKAFGSGLVEKDELLTGLTVEQGTLPASEENPTKASSTETSKQSTNQSAAAPDKQGLSASAMSSARGTPRRLAPAINTPSGYVKYSGDSIAFYYPSTWRMAETRSLLKICNDNGDEISLQRSKLQTPEAAFQEGLHMQQQYGGGGRSRRRHSGGHHGSSMFGGVTPVSYPHSLRFGVDNKFPGFQLAGVYKFPSARTATFENYFDRVVYFGWPGKVFSLRVKCLKDDAGTICSTFEKLLSSVVVERQK